MPYPPRRRRTLPPLMLLLLCRRRRRSRHLLPAAPLQILPPRSIAPTIHAAMIHATITTTIRATITMTTTTARRCPRGARRRRPKRPPPPSVRREGTETASTTMMRMWRRMRRVKTMAILKSSNSRASVGKGNKASSTRPWRRPNLGQHRPHRRHPSDRRSCAALGSAATTGWAWPWLRILVVLVVAMSHRGR